MAIAFIAFIAGMLAMAILYRISQKDDAAAVLRNIRKTINHWSDPSGRVARKDSFDVLIGIQDKIEAWVADNEL